MKNNKGFTLLELLITIAVMLAIVGIAVIAYVNISKGKKEEAYKEIVNQIENASKDFIDSNYYYLSGLKQNSDKLKVSLGTLVKNDYLNVATDPRTNKKISFCNYVEIKKDENGEISYEYKETDSKEKCDGLSYVVYEEAGAPSLETSIIGTKGNGDWYTSKTVTSRAEVKENENGKIEKVLYCIDTKDCQPTDNNIITSTNNNYDVKNTTLEGEYIYTKFVAINEYNKKAEGSVVYSKDSVAPLVTDTIITKTNYNGWYNKTTDKVELKFEIADETSGIASAKHYYNKKELTEKEANSSTYKWDGKKYPEADNPTDLTLTSGVKKWNGSGKFAAQGVRKSELYACDVAGNCSYSSEVTVKYDKTNPTCSVNLSGTQGKNNWFKSDVSISLTRSDNLSGIEKYGLDKNSSVTYNSVASGSKSTETNGENWYGYVKDKAGNEGSCNATIKIDKTNPTCSISVSKATIGNKVGDTQWYIGSTAPVLTLNTTNATSYDLTTSSTASYNNKKNITQSDEIAGTVFYGYVKDDAGNTNKCSINIGYEKSVTLTFDINKTNSNAKVIRKRNNCPNPNVNVGSTVFGSQKSSEKGENPPTCKFGECSNILCRTDSSKTNQCSKNNFARVCMYSGAFEKYFTASGKSVTNSNIAIRAANELPGVQNCGVSGDNIYSYDNTNKTCISQADENNTAKPGIRFVSEYTKSKRNFQSFWKNGKTYWYGYRDQDDSGGVDFEHDKIFYISPAGNKSSSIMLFIEYRVNCGYTDYGCSTSYSGN